MPLTRTLVVAGGGAAGAACRWYVDKLVGPTDWPWTLLLINVVGSFLLGLVLVRGSSAGRELLRLGAGVGFCGGLTTFSSFAVAAVRLVEDGRSASAAAFVAGSIVLGAAALVAGMRVRHEGISA
jgi:fluoride exporter